MPYDLLECPDGNLLRISLQPQNASKKSTKINNTIANFAPTIQIDDQNIVIDTKDTFSHQLNVDELNSDLFCLIEAPIKANLKVTSKRDVDIQNMYSDGKNVFVCY